MAYTFKVLWGGCSRDVSQTEVGALPTPLTSCMALGKWVNPLENRFPYQLNADCPTLLTLVRIKKDGVSI